MKRGARAPWPALLPISLSSLLPAALPRAAVRIVVVLFAGNFGENATYGQAIRITGLHAKTFILLANDRLRPFGVNRHTPETPRLLHASNMMAQRKSPPAALTIAGSDSGGGAGIEA